MKALSDEIDRGTYQHDHHPMVVRQNKWRAARYGLNAALVDSFTYELSSARDEVRSLVERLRPVALELGAAPYLDRAAELASGPAWADRQLALLEQTRDPAEVVRRMSAASRLSGEPSGSGISGIPGISIANTPRGPKDKGTSQAHPRPLPHEKPGCQTSISGESSGSIMKPSSRLCPGSSRPDP